MASEMESIDKIEIIRFPEVSKMLGGISKRTLYRWESAGKFPKRIKIGEKSTAWRLQEIYQWFKNKLEKE